MVRAILTLECGPDQIFRREKREKERPTIECHEEKHLERIEKDEKSLRKFLCQSLSPSTISKSIKRVSERNGRESHTVSRHTLHSGNAVNSWANRKRANYRLYVCAVLMYSDRKTYSGKESPLIDLSFRIDEFSLHVT